jgi:hypothetical protein
LNEIGSHYKYRVFTVYRVSPAVCKLVVLQECMKKEEFEKEEGGGTDHVTGVIREAR